MTLADDLAQLLRQCRKEPALYTDLARSRGNMTATADWPIEQRARNHELDNLALHGTIFYLQDAARLLPELLDEEQTDTSDQPYARQQLLASCLAQYMRAVLGMQHFVGRELAYITGADATLQNACTPMRLGGCQRTASTCRQYAV